MSACSLLVSDAPELEDRPCPCLDGYRCEAERCVLAGDAGTSEAGTSDAGASDAGTSDAGTSDAGAPLDSGGIDAGPRIDAGPLERCAEPVGRPVLFCDDFEGALGAKWDTSTSFGVVERVAEGGDMVLRAEATAAAGTAYVTHDDLPPASTLWGRVTIRVPAPSIPAVTNARDALSLGGATPYVRVLARDEGVTLAVGEEEQEAGAPSGTYCLRLEVRVASDATGYARLYLGDGMVAQILDVPTDPGGGLDRLFVGVVDAIGLVELRADDVVIDDAELACP